MKQTRINIIGAMVISIMMAALLFNTSAWSLPQGGAVVSGNSKITKPDAQTMHINQTTDKSIINWQGYSIGKSEMVQYFQPDSSSVSLNRVTGQDPSLIHGQLSANGQVWIINPNGLLIGKGAKINTGSFLGSTLNISNDDFLGGNYKFRQQGALASIRNLGSIISQEGGYVVLISPAATNEGSITTRLGKSYLASGSEVTLNFEGNGLIGFTIDREAAASALGITNKGTISANGGEVKLSAKVASELMKTVINNEGVIEAKTIQEKDGKIFLLGGMDHNAVEVSGRLDASAPTGGNGGFIETSAAKVKVKDNAVVTTAAPYGKTGMWLIDPTDFTIAASGGDETGSGLSGKLLNSNIEIQSSSDDINVNDNVSWSANELKLTAAHDININAVMTASGTSTLAMNTATSVAGGAVKVGFVPGQANGFAGRVDFPGRSGTGFLTINGQGYTVINSLGAEGSVTGKDLQGMTGNLTGYYAMGSDIDASATSKWNLGEGFVPVGYYRLTPPFSGAFNGLGHKVSGLTINRPAAESVGLFGWATGAMSNVGLVGGSITGSTDVGLLVGHSGGSAISNSYSTGAATGTYYIGGLVGHKWGGSISDSYSTGAVTGTSAVGGVVGLNLEATIINSYSTGSVTGHSAVGGLVGRSDGFISSVINSFGIGTVTGANQVGGLVGYSEGSITSSHNIGIVNGGHYVGGLVGYNKGRIANSYNTGNVTGTGYYVSGLTGYSIGGTISSSHNTGTVNGSEYVGGLVGYNYGDITNSYNIGNVTGAGNAVGGLVGYNYRSNIYTSYSSGAVTGNDYVGGLVGLNYLSNIYTSYNAGVVAGRDYVGGLIGYSGCDISESYNSGNVSGRNHVGGLIGVSYDTLGNTYSTGSVTGTSYVGGLVGSNYGAISNSYSAGAVIGTSNYIGGLVGSNNGSYLITNSFWDTQASHQTSSDGGDGKITADMKKLSTFKNAGWDIDDKTGTTGTIWRIVEGTNYPLMRYFNPSGSGAPAPSTINTKTPAHVPYISGIYDVLKSKSGVMTVAGDSYTGLWTQKTPSYEINPSVFGDD